MYTQFFRLSQAPFSISPDPRYLFMSERHREALAHLLYGIDSGGGIVLLTGDIGTGKTTICRCFLEQVPDNCNVAYIFNPKLTVVELLQAICEEFHIELPDGELQTAGTKEYIDALNRHLLAAHAAGRNSVLIIDEAQNLSPEVLEQLRLLTNLETNERKLLQIILIGQPELREMLAQPELKQLAQRVIAHYHLTALSEQETAGYIQHRLTTAGMMTASPFQPPLMKHIHRLTEGVPRRTNLLCDRALLGAYASGTQIVDRNILDRAASELFINQPALPSRPSRRYRIGALALLTIALAGVWLANSDGIGKAMHEGWTAATTATGEKVKDVLQLASEKLESDTSPQQPAVVRAAHRPAEDTEAILSVSDEELGRGLPGETSAIRQLGQLWGLTLDGDDPCQAAATAGARCYRSNAGFAEIQSLGRPAVIRLHGADGIASYALLTGLGDSAAVLRADDVKQTVSRLLLARHFRGEFVTLWRPPPGFDSIVGANDRGAAADWVAQRLAQLNGDTPPAPGEALGAKSVRQVRQFQQAQGLAVDGVVGPVTAMHISRATGVEEPRLHDALALLQARVGEEE